MKKILLILAVIFAPILFVGGAAYVYAAKKYNVSFNSVVWSIPQESDLYREADNLARGYPAVVKGNVEPAGMWMNRLLSDKANELRALGVNTVTVMPYYEYREGRAELKDPGIIIMRGESSAKAVYLRQIVQAKKLGLAVFLTPNFVGPSGQIFAGADAPENIPPDKFLEDSTRIALEWAKIAEEFKVEYFSPQGEIDLEISLNYFGHDWGKRHEAIKANNQWHQSLLPELRKVFGGRIVYKYTLESENINASGYDILAVDVGPWNDELDEFRDNMQRRFAIARASAAGAGADWMVGEFWAPHGDGALGVPGGMNLNLYGERGIKQETLYEIVFEEYARASLEIPGAGFMFGSFLMPGTGISGRPSEALVAEFFETL